MQVSVILGKANVTFYDNPFKNNKLYFKFKNICSSKDNIKNMKK